MSGKVLAAIAVGAMILGPYRITADEKKIDPCALVTKAEVEAAMGTLKEQPKAGTGLYPGISTSAKRFISILKSKQSHSTRSRRK